MLDTVVMSGDDVCCSVVFGTLVGVFVFSFMWSELLMTSAISCLSVVISVRVPESGVCVHISRCRTECSMFVMYMYAVLYVRVSKPCSAWMWCLEEVYHMTCY